jgi:hypothetical protein
LAFFNTYMILYEKAYFLYIHYFKISSIEVLNFTKLFSKNKQILSEKKGSTLNVIYSIFVLFFFSIALI